MQSITDPVHMSTHHPTSGPALHLPHADGMVTRHAVVQLRCLAKAVVVEHMPLLVVIAAYFGGVAVFLLLTGNSAGWHIRWFYPLSTVLFVAGSCVWLIAAPTARNSERVLGAVLVAALAAPFQSTFNSVKQLIGTLRGFTWDARLAEADRWLHFGRQPWEWLAPVVTHRGAILFLDVGYMLWFPAIFGFLFWAAWTADRTLRRHALVSVVLVWALCGNVAAMALPSAGPCYYDAVVAGRNPFAPLMTALDTHHERGFLLARFNQLALWHAMRSNTWLPFGGVSAMPSVHVAMAVLIALVGRARHAGYGMLLTVFALITMIGSIVLGWHYAIDGYVGAVMAYAIWRVVRLTV
jgi:hypothetical protein